MTYKNQTIDRIGSFQTEGVLCITDPCYTRGTWCAAWDVECVAGPWEAHTVEFEASSGGHRVCVLEANSAAISSAVLSQLEWQRTDNDICVDSGQCGIFDQARYPKDGDSTGEYGELDTFYGRACNATHDSKGEEKRYAGQIDEGVVSSSGFGDGSYTMYIRVFDGIVAAVKVVFIEEDEDF